jgi:cobalt/nickel transport system permease protein
VVVVTKQELQFRKFEELACISSGVHRLHPVAPFLVILAYIITLTSYPSDAFINLIPLTLFPPIFARLARLPLGLLVRSTLKVLPLIIVIGILHPLIDTRPMQIGSFTLHHGWLVFASLLIKGFLTILANFLLISTLGISGLQRAMKTLGLPPVFYHLFTMVYRYIMLLMEEVYRVLRAYELRSGRKPKLRAQEWGSLPGGILLRTYEQGLRIQHAMEMRGYSPKQPFGKEQSLERKDILFAASWLAVFVCLRMEFFHG